MSILIVAAIALAAFLLLDKLVLPWISKIEFKRGKIPEIQKLVWISIISIARLFSLTTFLVYASFWTLLNLISLFGNSGRIAGSLLSGLISANNLVSQISSEKSYWILIISALIFIIIVTRSVKIYALTIYENLKKKQEANQLEFIPPTSDMYLMQQELEKAENGLKELNYINPAELSEEEKSVVSENFAFLDRFIPALRNAIIDVDIRRRIIAEVELKNQRQNKSMSFLSRVSTFFTSKGMVYSISSLNKNLARITIVFLVLSFLSANGNLLNKEIYSQSNKLSSMIVDAKQKKIDSEYIKVTEIESEENDELTEDDQQIARLIARRAELQIARSLLNNSIQFQQASAFKVSANIQKQNILKSFSTNADGSVKKGLEFMKIGQNVDSELSEIKFGKHWYEKASTSLNANAPQTSAGKKLEQELLSRAKTSKGSWKAIKTDFVKSFSTRASVNDVFGLLVQESIAEFADDAAKSTVTRELTESITKNVSKNTLTKWVDYKTKEFATDIFADKKVTLESAFDNIASMNSPEDKFIKFGLENSDIPIKKQVITNFSEFPSTIEVDEFTRIQKNKTVNSLVKISRSIDQPLATFAEAASNFKYHFPGQLGNASNTTASRVLAQSTTSSFDNILLEGVAQVGSETLKGLGKNSSRTSFSRARSFTRLKGFRRIGGVLIGREPENLGNSDADFVDFSWNLIGNQTTLSLTRKDGKKIEVGPFDTDIASQALAYAADERPIATTMISAKPVPYLKILVHPALINTRLGCESVGLDRLVDKYALGIPMVEEAMNQRALGDILYKFVVYKLIQRSITENFEEDLADEVLFKLEISPQDLSITDNWNNIYALRSILNNPSKSVIAAKPESYNKELVTDIIKSLESSSNDPKKFIEDLEENNIYEKLIDVESSDLQSTFNERGLNEYFYFSDPEAQAVTTVYHLINKYILVNPEEWSGVREMEYNVDKDLNFVMHQGNNPLYPLRFMRQVVLTSLYQDTENIEAEDDDPWEFPELKKDKIIENAVLDSVYNNNNYKDKALLERMTSFTLAQRLFKAILNGDLGVNFPLEKLQSFMEATKIHVVEVATPTWNVTRLRKFLINRILADLDSSSIETKVSNDFRDAAYEYYKTTNINVDFFDARAYKEFVMAYENLILTFRYGESVDLDSYKEFIDANEIHSNKNLEPCK